MLEWPKARNIRTELSPPVVYKGCELRYSSESRTNCGPWSLVFKTTFLLELVGSRFPIIPSSYYECTNSRARWPLLVQYWRTCPFAGLFHHQWRSVRTSRRAVSRQITRTHASLSTYFVLVHRDREIDLEFTIQKCEILRSESRLYVEVGVVSMTSGFTRDWLKRPEEMIDATFKRHSWDKLWPSLTSIHPVCMKRPYRERFHAYQCSCEL